MAKKEATKPKPEKRIGERLLEAGLITREQLNLALQEQERTGGYLGELLDELGFVDQATITEFLAKQAGTESVDVRQLLVNPSVIAKVPAPLAKRCRAMPLDYLSVQGALKVAMADPSDVMAIDSLEQGTGLRVDVLAAPVQDIDHAIYHHYEKQGSVQKTIDELMKRGAAGTTEAESAQEAPLIRLVEQILSRAADIGASDIHIEPEEKILRVRMRVDGVLHQEILIPKVLQQAITARVKIIGGLDLTEHRVPQDGRTVITIANKEINLRLSTLPTTYGENIVMRLLDTSNLNLKLSSIGFSAPDLEKFRSVLKKPHGVILITGPTGSGKTTTLYSALNAVSSMENSVFTMEDPVEYQLPLIRQTQVNEEVGMTFAAGLRALLRQDPDIILVGETRDTETAQLMIRAALTGHLVFSTLHTNSSVEAIPRLTDMGIERYLLPAAMQAILAQRLVRRICSQCKEEGEETKEIFQKYGIQIPENAPARLARGRGCSACNDTGYKGRVPVYEVFVVGKDFHDPILNGAGAEELLQMARQRGMTTMFEDGAQKVCEGKTTLEEVLRVVSVEGV